MKLLGIVGQQPGVVVQHLFKVRDNPPRVRGIPVKSAAQLIVHAAARRFRQRARDHLQQGIVMRPGKPAEQQLDRGWMWKFWRVTESAVRGIERPPDAIDAGGEQRWIERPGARWRVTRGELTVQLRGGVPGLVPALAVVLRHAQQDAGEARPAECVNRGGTGAARKT